MLSDTGLTPDEILTDLHGAADVVAAAVGALASAGARTLLLFDVPNLGLTPEITQLGDPLLAAAASLLAQTFNTFVLAGISADAPGLKVYDIDTYDLLTEAVGDKDKFGFTNVTDPCWTGSVIGYFGGGTLCAPDLAGQDKYLFWDTEHPTAAGHMLVAEAAAAMVPEPSTWVMLLTGLAGLGLAAASRARPADA